MSIELVSEVFDHCPAEVSPAERLILLAIAEQAQDKDRTDGGRFIAARTCFPGQGLMERMTGLGKSGFGDALRRLSKRNLEVRVAIAIDKSGRPIYAAKGHNTVYRLPALKGLATATPLPAPKALAAARPLPLKGLALTTQRSCSDDTKVLPQQGPNHKEPEVTSLPTLIDVSTPSATSQKADTENEFLQWYSTYPKKQAKAAARKAFTTARKKTDLGTLLASTQAYANSVKGKELRFIAMPASWLNQDRWEDELTPQRSQPTAGTPWSKEFHQ